MGLVEFFLHTYPDTVLLADGLTEIFAIIQYKRLRQAHNISFCLPVYIFTHFVAVNKIVKLVNATPSQKDDKVTMNEMDVISAV